MKQRRLGAGAGPSVARRAAACCCLRCAAAAAVTAATDVTLSSYRCPERGVKGRGAEDGLGRDDNASIRLDYFRVAGGGHTLPGAPPVWRGLGPTSTFDGFGAIMRSWAGDELGSWPANAADGGGASAAGLDAGLVLGAVAAAAEALCP